MEQVVLKQDILDKIKDDADLFTAVSKALKKSIYTLPALLRRNDPQLTQKASLRAIARHLRIKENDLVQIIKDKEFVG